LKYKTTMRT